MSDIGTGDWVECVYAGPSRHEDWRGWLDGHERLVGGAVYRVEGIHPDGHGIFIAPKSNHHDGSWGTYRFKPIYRPKADFIESLKQPAPRERVPA